ncbi:MAG: hypothetical protein R2797_12100 [Gelidibacter sp.]
MDKKTIKIMTKTKRLKLSKSDLFWHFSIVPLFLIAPIFTLWSFVEYYLLETYDGVRTPIELSKAGIGFLIVAIFFFVLQRNRLKFKEYKSLTNIEIQSFDLAIQQTARELDWKMDVWEEDFAKAHRNRSDIASRGEMITIIRKNNKILINSICDPNKLTSVSSLGWNKTNRETFIRNLNASRQHRI